MPLFNRGALKGQEQCRRTVFIGSVLQGFGQTLLILAVSPAREAKQREPGRRPGIVANNAN